MSDNLTPGLGATFFVCATLPANELAATYEALTWIEVGEVVDIPEYGASHDVVTHVPLKTGITAKYHGAKNNGSLSIPFGIDGTDTGQAALKTALANKARVAFQVADASGAAEFFQGKVFSYTRGANIGQVRTATVQIELETDIVDGDAA